MPKVTLKFKEAVLKEIQLDKEVIIIGRNPDNDIHIDNPAVSGSHAKIINEGGRIFIEDMNSTNGTFINGKKISKSALNNNDIITVGKHTLVFSGPSQAAEADKTMKTKKPGLNETIVLDTRAQKAMQAEASGAAASGEKIGGFTVIEGSAEKNEYELTKRLTTIGKTETAEIKLKGFFAPKVAALINRTKDGYFISPPGTKTKIKINGNSLEGRYELKDGDIVEVEHLKMQFYIKA
ncbi:MAG: FHA domain-containing protein [Thermodesulfovibrionales bacterium]|nr:FHA domain-containing protein [Thermodesulfovibrionales bacterium]